MTPAPATPSSPKRKPFTASVSVDRLKPANSIENMKSKRKGEVTVEQSKAEAEQQITTVIIDKPSSSYLPTRETIWNIFTVLLKYLKVADNKDKLLKILQYIAKLLVVYGRSDPWNVKGVKAADMKVLASTLSLARKLGRLGNWLPAINDLVDLAEDRKKSSGNVDYEESLKWTATIASFGNDLLDDWICLQKGRFLPTVGYLDTLDAWSTRLWFLSVSIDLHFTAKKYQKFLEYQVEEASTKAEDEEIRRKRVDLQLAAAKQLCDWTFCAWELAGLADKTGKIGELVPVISGLSAAVIGAIRGWRKLS